MSAHECNRFMTNPLAYTRDVCINLQTASGQTATGGFNARISHAPCWFDLVPWSTSFFSSASQVMLAPQSARGTGLIQGYYVPYIAYGSVASSSTDHIDPVLLADVPKTLPPWPFVFTGGQNGCSLLMLKGSTANTVSFFHYPNSTGKAAGYPLLAQVGKTAADILVAIDFDLYGEADNPNACSFFWYNGTRWVGVTQPQVQGAADMTHGRPTMSINRSKPPRTVSETGGGVIP